MNLSTTINQVRATWVNSSYTTPTSLLAKRGDNWYAVVSDSEKILKVVNLSGQPMNLPIKYCPKTQNQNQNYKEVYYQCSDNFIISSCHPTVEIDKFVADNIVPIINKWLGQDK